MSESMSKSENEILDESEDLIDIIGIDKNDDRLVNAENFRVATESEQNILKDIKNGLKRKYKIFAWKLEGELSIEKYKTAYNDLLSKNSSLRSHYIIDGVNMPMYVVNKNKGRFFKLMDLRSTSEENQKTFIQNVILAMSRENYNPEEDIPIKLHVYLLGNRKIEVILGLYTYFGDIVSADDVRRNVFMGLRTSDATPMFFIEEEKSEQLVRENNKKCFSYWKKEAFPVGKRCTVPFAYNKSNPLATESYELEYEVSEDLNAKLWKTVGEKEYDYESVLLFCFSKLIKEYNETESPLLFVRDDLSLLSVRPIKVRSYLDDNACLEDIFRQFEYGKSFTDCTFGDFCSEFDLDKRKDFEILFDFINEEDVNGGTKTENMLKKVNAKNSAQFVPRLEICAIFSKKEHMLKIRYTYETDGISEDTIHMIHDAFIQAINEIVFTAGKFEWKKYVSEYKDDKEKLYKLNIAQKALHIKTGDFLEVKDPRDVLLLAEDSKVGTYMIEDCVYNAGKRLDYMGVLFEGHVEERYVGADGITKTLSVYKKGYIIGMEAFTDTPKSDFSYVAAENGVKIIWIPVADLIRVLNRDTVSYCNLLKKSLNETKRIKKLWSLE